ncbi:hypothetical protein [Legionella fairfieldensis]|uniref:hypothetical protein n=1 Tax=Legionella fairfieldensis TaxID=45064 RepID=UPI00048C8400|nr:hypothetical protein [Legionella fairfieldensis]
MSIKSLLCELETRLPELEWKMKESASAFSMTSLPPGLFHLFQEPTPAACIAEIKENIQTLGRQKSECSAYYLAQRIHRKINVLVTLCYLQSKKPKVEENVNFNLNKISTRQQWLSSLEHTINELTIQREAMMNALKQMQIRGNTQAILTLQGEVGKIEKRLTLAEETLARAQSL